MKRVFCLAALALLLFALTFSLFCLRFTRGDALGATSAYCEGHGALSVSIILPDVLPRAEDIWEKLEATVPPILSLSPILLREMLSGLWKEAKCAVGTELDGCTAFP